MYSVIREDGLLLTSNRHRLKNEDCDRKKKKRKKIKLWTVKRLIQKEIASLAPILLFIVAISFINSL